MGLLSILLLSVSLSLDSFAAAIANGLCMTEVKLTKALKIAIPFALFQTVLPFLGWYAGKSVYELIMGIDHWIAFILLLLIGGKMIIENSIAGEKTKPNDLSFKNILLQSIATSIDAFAVGISLSLLKEKILLPLILIGITTFAFSLIGVYLGKIIGSRFGKFVGVIGGIILIIIGTRILLEHTIL